MSEDELATLFERAVRDSLQDLKFTDAARSLLIGYADGDARRLLNLIEQLETAAKTEGVLEIDGDYLGNALSSNVRRFDKGGDEFHDQISALHKSVRGSNPDAALYWMCRMLDGGTDPLYIGRRLIRAAVEDVGLADPRALQISLDACETYKRLGSPEGELALAQATLYLASAPKSNAAYLAYNKTLSFIKSDQSRQVPGHLRNAPTKLMKDLGIGREYRYPHDNPEAYAAGESYLPDGIQDLKLYQPTTRGLEGKISEKLAYLHELDKHTQKKT
jgi:putative ATPase